MKQAPAAAAEVRVAVAVVQVAAAPAVAAPVAEVVAVVQVEAALEEEEVVVVARRRRHPRHLRWSCLPVAVLMTLPVLF